MKVALIHEASFPVLAYGGTERVVWWLAKGLAENRVDVTLVCRPGSTCPFAKTASADFTKPIEEQLPSFDVYHHFVTPSAKPAAPHLVTIGGNGKAGERYLPNTVFVSRDHAERHGATCFVHNGLDPAEYVFEPRKSDRLLFLAKAAWAVKNVRGAVRMARKAHRPIDIVGGSRWWLPSWRGAHWRGMLGGERKARFLAESAALLFPVLWDEPFGIAVAEAWISGTPVLATPFGSLPELMGPEVGALCGSEEAFVKAIEGVGRFSPEACREWALARFTYRQMTERYLELYKKVLAGEDLNAQAPGVSSAKGGMYSLPSRIA